MYNWESLFRCWMTRKNRGQTKDEASFIQIAWPAQQCDCCTPYPTTKVQVLERQGQINTTANACLLFYIWISLTLYVFIHPSVYVPNSTWLPLVSPASEYERWFLWSQYPWIILFVQENPRLIQLRHHLCKTSSQDVIKWVKIS